MRSLGVCARTHVKSTVVLCCHVCVCACAVLPNGVLTGIDIGFSNKSLAYITMSFYVMCKSTVPIFLLLCAFIWRIERYDTHTHTHTHTHTSHIDTGWSMSRTSSVTPSA